MLETEYKNFDNLINRLKELNISSEINNNTIKPAAMEATNPNALSYEDEDALMINDSVNEFSVEHDLQHTASKLIQANTILLNYTNQSVPFLDTLGQISNGKLRQRAIDAVKDLPVVIAAMPVQHIYESCMFTMRTELSNNFTFKVAEECHIEFSCPDISAGQKLGANQAKFFDYLKCILHDNGGNGNELPTRLKEKRLNNTRFIRVYFNPATSGIHRLSIRYNRSEIPNSPFNFVVLPKLLVAKSESETSFVSMASSGISPSVVAAASIKPAPETNSIASSISHKPLEFVSVLNRTSLAQRNMSTSSIPDRLIPSKIKHFVSSYRSCNENIVLLRLFKKKKFNDNDDKYFFH